MFRLDIDPHTLVIVVGHTVLLALFLIHILQGIGQARAASGTHPYMDA
jgi:hypothetical protein